MVHRWNLARTTGSRTRLLAIVLALALVVAACGDDDAGGGEAATEEVDGNDLAAEQVLRVRVDAFPESLDPAAVERDDAEQVANNVFNGLVDYDLEGELVPDLAESWETSDDLTEWTFTLRDGVTFHHDYGELTADDVVFSYERIQDPATASFHAAEFENVESFAAPDDRTVVITLNEPDAYFLHKVANYHQGQVVSRAAVEELGEDFATSPVGTGPFALDSYDAANAQIVLVRHDDYFEGPATLTEVRMTEVSDEEAAAIALENGEFDIAMDITGTERLPQLEEAGFVVHSEVRSTLMTMLNPETQPAFADERVRKAFMHAIDFETIIETVAPVTEDPAVNIFPEKMAEYTDDVTTYEYDPDRARELLAEAGYADGLTVKRLIRGSDGVEDRDLLEQEYLAEVGITEEFETVEVSDFSERRFNGDFEIATRSNAEPNIDFLATNLLLPDNVPPGGFNAARYDNPEVTALVEEARQTADQDERTAMYHDIQQMVMEDLPYLPENTLRQHWPAWDYVDGVQLNNQALIEFYGVSLLAHE